MSLERREDMGQQHVTERSMHRRRKMRSGVKTDGWFYLLSSIVQEYCFVSEIIPPLATNFFIFSQVTTLDTATQLHGGFEVDSN